jgi:hypothetical protein
VKHEKINWNRIYRNGSALCAVALQATRMKRMPEPSWKCTSVNCQLRTVGNEVPLSNLKPWAPEIADVFRTRSTEPLCDIAKRFHTRRKALFCRATSAATTIMRAHQTSAVCEAMGDEIRSKEVRSQSRSLKASKARVARAAKKTSGEREGVVMTKRNPQVTRWLSTNPAIGVCMACRKPFTGPMTALSKT